MQIRTSYIRKSDLDSQGNPFQSSVSFTSTTASPQVAKKRQQKDELYKLFLMWLKSRAQESSQETNDTEDSFEVSEEQDPDNSIWEG